MAVKEYEWEYNPVKIPKDGAEAEKVIWTTKALNIAVNAMKQGLPLKANPFCGKNVQLLKPDLVYKRTAEEISDYIKCKKDPIYFASKCFLMTPEGLKPCILRDYQIEYLNILKANNFTIFRACRQCGKSVTTAIFCLWYILFNTDMAGLILSKSGPAGIDLMSKLKDMYLNLPYHLKAGTMKWNQHEIGLDNNSSIATEAFSPTAGLGKTINFLILDEFAWCPPNDVELFYQNVIPTVTTQPNAHVAIMSTQNGFNLFYKLFKGAQEHRNIYKDFTVDWWQVPQFNPETKQWEKRTEAWKNKMVGILGSEEAFYYQYGTQFAASDNCLVSRECISNIRDRVKLFENKQELNIFLNHPENLYFKPDFDIKSLYTDWFVVLCDLAEGGGGEADSTVFQIMRINGKKLEQVGYYKSNNIDLENVALEFWLLCVQLFNNDRCLISLEWNTYGGLFYNYIMILNEMEMHPDCLYRFNYATSYDGFDMSRIVMYKKDLSNNEAQQGGMKKNQPKTIPGIRWNGENKKTSCALLRIELEKNTVEINDLVTSGELENFEDKNGNGVFKASYGHDDLIMTLVQIPMLRETPSFKELMEEFENSQYNQNKTLDILNNFGQMIEMTQLSQSFKNDTQFNFYSYGKDLY
jgi:hypothetical protein